MAYQHSTPVQELETPELVQLVQAGDEAAFELLVRKYQDRVYNTALRLVGNPDDAFDVSQEVFLNCFRKIEGFRGDSKFLTWIYRVTVNTVKNRWKYNERRGYGRTYSLHELVDAEDRALEEKLENPGPGPRKIASDRELHAILLDKLSEIDHEYREVLVLRCIEELSYEEIAEILQCSIGTIKSRIHRARELMRQKMRKFVQ